MIIKPKEFLQWNDATVWQSCDWSVTCIQKAGRIGPNLIGTTSMPRFTYLLILKQYRTGMQFSIQLWRLFYEWILIHQVRHKRIFKSHLDYVKCAINAKFITPLINKFLLWTNLQVTRRMYWLHGLGVKNIIPTYLLCFRCTILITKENLSHSPSTYNVFATQSWFLQFTHYTELYTVWQTFNYHPQNWPKLSHHKINVCQK